MHVYVHVHMRVGGVCTWQVCVQPLPCPSSQGGLNSVSLHVRKLRPREPSRVLSHTASPWQSQDQVQSLCPKARSPASHSQGLLPCTPATRLPHRLTLVS